MGRRAPMVTPVERAFHEHAGRGRSDAGPDDRQEVVSKVRE